MQGEKSPDPQRASLTFLTDINTIVKIGYARKTDQQPTVKEQLDALERYGCKTIFTDTGISNNLHEMEKMLAVVEKGDTVCVQHLCCLGRTSYEIIDFINHLTERHVYLMSLEETIDTRTDEGRKRIGFLNSMVEHDRQAFVNRTQAGIKEARKKGRSPGRKKTGLAEKYRKIAKPLYVMYKSGEYTVAEILDFFSVKSRSTFYRIVNFWESEKKKRRHKIFGFFLYLLITTESR